MSTDIAVGVLGAGNIGTVHVQSARAMDGVSVECVADTDPGRRERVERLGVDRVYEDYRALLAAEPLDVVVVALPPFLHCEATVEAARRGSNVFVEKPFARTPAEGQRMIEAADDGGVVLGVDHTLRYQPEIQRLHEEYESGRLGHVPLATATRVNHGPFEPPEPSAPVPDWQLDPEATGGGALIDLGVHLLDVLEWFFGGLELRHAELETQLNLPYEDTATLVLRSTESGTTAVLNCGFFQWERPPDINTSVRLDGITETVDSSQYLPRNLFVHASKAAAKNVVRRAVGREPSYFEPTYYYRAHFEALREFVEAVRAGRTPPVTGVDGLRTVEIVSQAYEMAGKRSPVPTVEVGR
jgi:predicted dehydrogenase